MRSLMTPALLTGIAAALIPGGAAAQDQAGVSVLVGAGARVRPVYPGADHSRIGLAPVFEVWRSGEPFPAEAPDESIGFAVVGERGKTSIGPALAFSQRRSAADLPGQPAVGFGVEAGLFAEHYLHPSIRLRGELRHGIGGHRALTGDLGADWVLRAGPEFVATIGPRARWGSGKFQSAYFGTAAATASALPAYQPRAGFHAVGVSAGAHLFLDSRWGLYGYAGYDRLTGPAARSPVVAMGGSRDQVSGGLALTYRFQITR